MAGTGPDERGPLDHAHDALGRLGFPPTRETAFAFLASVAAYTTASVFLDDLLAVDGLLVVELSDGLAVPLGIVFGPPAAVGVGVGVIVSDLLNGALSAGSVLVTGAHVVLAYVAYVGWRRYHSLLGSNRPAKPRLRPVFGFTVVTLVASLVAASFLGWTYELVGVFPFYISFGFNFLDFVIATAVVSPLIGYPLLRAEQSFSRPSPSAVESARVNGMTTADRTVIGVAIAWALFGVVGSVGFDVRSRLTIRAFRRRGLVPLYEWVHPAVFGHGGRRAQVVFGTVMFLILVVAIARTLGWEGPRWN